MRGKDLIERIKEHQLEEADVDKWLIHKVKTNIKHLSLLEAGKAIRILLPILGKPKMNYNVDASGKTLNCRVVVWHLYNQLDKQIEASEALETAEITDFNITPSEYFTLHLERHLFFSAFTTSDDPQEWERQQKYWEERTENNRIKKEAKKLKEQEEYDAAHAAEWEESKRKYQEEQAKKKRDEEEKERLAELGKQTLKKQEEFSQIRHEDIVNVGRSIKVEGGD